MSTPVKDLGGIGIGPSNLSIAALLREAPDVDAAFFERNPEFDWHPGLMFKEARLQTSFLKDLVTGVSPTNPCSFINYLVRTGRFYQFMSAAMDAVTRREFADYMAWVVDKLGGLHFGTPVHELHFAGDHFVIRHAKGVTRARHVSLGTGRTPHVPACAQPLLGERCFHAIDILKRMPAMRGARVAIIGGGQTGAEVLLNSLRGLWGTPREVCWISRRSNFAPLDETPFTNELFTPSYVRVFHDLDDHRRRELVAEQKLASDGISSSTLRELYRALYEQQLEQSGAEVQLLPGRQMTALHRRGTEFELTACNHLDGSHEQHRVDLVILCTGFDEKLPDYLEPIRERLHIDPHGRLQLGSHFEVAWDGPAGNRIYALNVGRYSHGIAEPQLSLAAWRSAVIINHIAGREVFDVDAAVGLVRWRTVPRDRTHALGA